MTPSSVSLLDTSPMLRRLSADETPFAGRLHGGQSPAVHVDVTHVPDELWRCDPDGNLLMPRELSRTPTGLEAVFVPCTRRLIEVVQSTVAPGACVTIGVSLLRAAAEARAHGFDTGSWWIDASGRPVLAPTASGDWIVEAQAILDRLAAGARSELREALAATTRLIAEPRWSSGAADACEDRLFAAADPCQIDAAELRGLSEDVAPLRATTLRRDTPIETWTERFADEGWAHRLREARRALLTAPSLVIDRWRERQAQRPARTDSRSESRTKMRTEARAMPRTDPEAKARTRSPAHTPTDTPAQAPRLRAPLFVAVGAAAVVITVGLLWPGGSDPADARPAAVTDAYSPAPSTPVPNPAGPGGDAEPSTGMPAEPAAQNDPTAIASAALRALRACAGDRAACEGVLEDPARQPPSGVALSDARSTTTLLDEYGGVTVFRVEAPDSPPQILVLVSADGKWLVRDVYDVADQP
ncbi:MAG: hypothetical protein ABS63_07025 [Microbacterium sp. SCN 70-27]|uniref:hypothetical protein n=1 Tax=unclassified Microbacterium TaxID=2609290 RepID=UPI00086E49EE|nr:MULTISPECIES: hypothetical protein [unclassified Microbacterium]MBN9223304.1 hypothetical protein [Microbacterium sp.]ODT27818.1 MAG: hypothetical protein ABS63_07025 [Microbacterium sp. SCN 70-27]